MGEAMQEIKETGYTVHFQQAIEPSSENWVFDAVMPAPPRPQPQPQPRLVFNAVVPSFGLETA